MDDNAVRIRCGNKVIVSDVSVDPDEFIKDPVGSFRRAVIQQKGWDLGVISEFVGEWVDSETDSIALDFGVASMEAAGKQFIELFPALNQDIENPVTLHTDSLSMVIIDLNDNQKWTRQEIADWLETLDLEMDIAW